MQRTGMSNRIRDWRILALSAAAATLSACAGTSWEPLAHGEAAYAVASSVKAETRMDSSCYRTAARLASARISVELREAGARQSLVEARAAWDSRGCPAAAVPGIAFGAADAARVLRKSAAGAAT